MSFSARSVATSPSFTVQFGAGPKYRATFLGKLGKVLADFVRDQYNPASPMRAQEHHAQGTGADAGFDVTRAPGKRSAQSRMGPMSLG